MLIALWSLCSFSTKPFKLSCTISLSVVDNVSPVNVIPVPPTKFVSSDISIVPSVIACPAKDK
jgi:hypothetical protein